MYRLHLRTGQAKRNQMKVYVAGHPMDFGALPRFVSWLVLWIHLFALGEQKLPPTKLLLCQATRSSFGTKEVLIEHAHDRHHPSDHGTNRGEEGDPSFAIGFRDHNMQR
mmetsp:Transcript_24528/g.51035  ORF Transcript_24528/g.51035 Transcript_24528/m.51035 type:complete len:109 (-) Transcript_24528:397-723(-)